MILSVSRRTDIPQYYSDWFFNRMKEGFLYVRNPMNSHQISRINLSPDLVDCIVFWTKNPDPMLGRIGELGDIPFYIQVTLTGYGRDIEPGVPHKKKMIEILKRTAGIVGPERLVWRYDPIFINHTYTREYHCHAFEEIARGLCGCTEKVVISFLDMYGKTVRNMKGIPVERLAEPDTVRMASCMAVIAREYGMETVSCAETVDLSGAGVGHGSCIDPRLIGRLLGGTVESGKDRNQRSGCGCIESVEVGAYDTCLCGCKYCYANDSPGAVERKCRSWDVNSPLLCGSIGEGDRITERKVKKLVVSRENCYNMRMAQDQGVFKNFFPTDVRSTLGEDLPPMKEV